MGQAQVLGLSLSLSISLLCRTAAAKVAVGDMDCGNEATAAIRFVDGAAVVADHVASCLAIAIVFFAKRKLDALFTATPPATPRVGGADGGQLAILRLARRLVAAVEPVAADELAGVSADRFDQPGQMWCRERLFHQQPAAIPSVLSFAEDQRAETTDAEDVCLRFRMAVLRANGSQDLPSHVI